MTGKTDTKAANDAAANDAAQQPETTPEQAVLNTLTLRLGERGLLPEGADGEDFDPIETAMRVIDQQGGELDVVCADREFLIRGLRDRGVAEEQTTADAFNPIEEALRQIDYHQREGEALKRQLAAQKGATTRVRNQAAALEAEMPKKPRDFRANVNLLSSEALERVEDADKVELAFINSDGREVPNLAPRDLTGAPISMVRGRLRPELSELKVYGPNRLEPAHAIAGYVLLADGEPVAKTRRSDVLTIGAGQTMELKGDVIF